MLQDNGCAVVWATYDLGSVNSVKRILEEEDAVIQGRAKIDSPRAGTGLYIVQMFFRTAEYMFILSRHEDTLREKIARIESVFAGACHFYKLS